MKIKKDILMTFVDYGIVLLLSFFGLMVFSWMLELSWGGTAYSIIFTLILFGMVYSRGWNGAKRDLKYNKEAATLKNGMIFTIPLTAVNLCIIAFFALVNLNIIPLRDWVVNIVYEFPENLPRIRHEITFAQTMIPYIRIWFSYLVGFMNEQTSALVLLISPAITFAAGLLGYYAGRKNSTSVTKLSW